MLLFLYYLDGRREDAVLLSVAGNTMRVSVRDRDHCTELTLCDGQWVTGECKPVEIEFLATTAEEEWFRFVDALFEEDELTAALEAAGRPATT